MANDITQRTSNQSSDRPGSLNQRANQTARNTTAMQTTEDGSIFPTQSESTSAVDTGALAVSDITAEFNAPPRVSAQDDLEGQTQQFTFPRETQASNAQGILSRIDSILEQGDTVRDREQLQQTDTALQQRIAETIGTLSTRGAVTEELQQELGISTKAQELADIQNTIRSKQKSYRDRIERARNEAGLTAGQQNARVGEIERKAASELADLAIIEQAKQNNLTTARDLVKDKVELRFADEQTKLEGLQFFFNNNRDLLDKATEEEIQQNLLRQKTKLNVAIDQTQRLEEEKLEILRQANQNGAPNAVLQSIEDAETVGEARQSAGEYAVDVTERLRQQKLSSDIQRNRAETFAALNSIAPGGQPSFEDMADIRGTLLKEPSIKNLQDIRNGFQNVQQGTRLNNAQGDLAIVNGIAKMLDPGSVVRPGEFDTVGEAQGFLERYTNVKTLTQGDRLKPETRKEFQRLADALVLTKGMAAKNTIESLYGSQLEQKGVSVEQAAPIVADINRIVDQNKEEANNIIAEQVGFDVEAAREQYTEEEIASYLQNQLQIGN